MWMSTCVQVYHSFFRPVLQNWFTEVFIAVLEAITQPILIKLQGLVASIKGIQTINKIYGM